MSAAMALSQLPVLPADHDTEEAQFCTSSTSVRQGRPMQRTCHAVDQADSHWNARAAIATGVAAFAQGVTTIVEIFWLSRPILPRFLHHTVGRKSSVDFGNARNINRGSST